LTNSIAEQCSHANLVQEASIFTFTLLQNLIRHHLEIGGKLHVKFNTEFKG